MNATEVNDVLDKLAEKIGVAADKIVPVAEEVVRQYQLRSCVYASSAAIMVLIGVAAVAMGVKVMRAKQPKGSRMSSVDYLTNHEVAGGITLVVGCVCAFVGTLVATSNIARALAPLPSILGL